MHANGGESCRVALLSMVVQAGEEADAAPILSRAEGLRAAALAPEPARAFRHARLRIRQQLGIWLNLDPAAVPLENLPGGAPVLAGMDQRVSWSHAGGVVALALAPARHLGIDAECHGRLGLGPAALARLLPEPRPRARDEATVLASWTAREAILKAIGSGFRTHEPAAVALPNSYLDPRGRAWSDSIAAPDGTVLNLGTWLLPAITLSLASDGPLPQFTPRRPPIPGADAHPNLLRSPFPGYPRPR